ncbi:MAG: hypothetical protein MZV64_42790 [Ignavibacteriales bacterium]|nr:hypothetical protein [Ignavibacteriales bacterium]
MPGLAATFLGTAVSGTGIYKRQTSRLAEGVRSMNPPATLPFLLAAVVGSPWPSAPRRHGARRRRPS